MSLQSDKVQDKKSQSIANTVSSNQNEGKSALQFKDNRPEAIAQRKLKEMAEHHSAQQQQSPEVSGPPIQKKENDTGLPDSLKSGIENLSGLSMDDVKVHHNSDKPAQLQAHAYAQGTDIHLGSGQEKHLPHEAWHVVQQKQGRVKPTMQMKGGVNVNDDRGLEKEADLMGSKAMQFKSIYKTSHSNTNSWSTNGGLSTLSIQFKLNTTADEFDTATTIKRMIVSDYRLPLIVEALRGYEAANSPEGEMAGLIKVRKACDQEYDGAQTAQKGSITNLRFALTQEARAILSAVVKHRLGTRSLLSESLAAATRNSNLYIELGITNPEYQQVVDNLVVFKNGASAKFKDFLATNPEAKDTKQAFTTSFKQYLLADNKIITIDAITHIDGEINAGWEKQKARATDKENLKGLFDIGDGVQDAPAENRVSKAEFEQLALMYSHIREGDSKIKFQNTKRTGGQDIENDQMSADQLKDYKSAALRDTAKILRTKVGRKLLTSMHQGGKTGASEFKLGAVSNPSLAGAGSDDATLSSDGTGTGGTVYYQPGADITHSISTEQNKTFTSDTALFHEMTHAYHSGQGTRITNDQTVGILDATDFSDIGVKKEEYATVGLGNHANDEITENAYRAAHTKLAGADQTIKDKYKPRLSYN